MSSTVLPPLDADALRRLARDATSTEHGRIDSHPAVTRLLERPLDTVRYIQLLRLFNGFWDALETVYDAPAIRSSLGEKDVESRRRASTLRAEIAALSGGLEPTRPPQAAWRPAAKDDLFYWGWGYVVEGARLGGTMIAAMRDEDGCAPLPPGAPRFFQRTGGGAFQTYLITAASAIDDDQTVTAFLGGARYAFDQILRAFARAEKDVRASAEPT